jgi:prepilin-type N-terminal cleavage/methylation domain-containing protein
LKSEKGFSLIETLIALVLFGMISVSVSMGLSMAARSNMICDEHTTAESLARSQIEYVQDQSYGDPASYQMITVPDNYSIVTPFVTSWETGIQKITVSVLHGSKTVLTLEDYKVDR